MSWTDNSNTEIHISTLCPADLLQLMPPLAGWPIGTSAEADWEWRQQASKQRITSYVTQNSLASLANGYIPAL